MALKRYQYDTIIRSYHKKQLQNAHNLKKRISEVYEQIPQIEEIDQTIASYSVSQAKRLLNGDDTALDALKSRLTALKEKRQELLLNSDFPEDYLTESYSCPDCKDTGYVDGKKCHCFKQATIEMLYTQSNIKDILLRENFGTFSFAYYSDDSVNPLTGLSPLANMKSVVHTCRSFIEDFDNTFENLFFYGDTGVGKTFLTNCIAKELIDRAHSVIYLSAIQLFDIFADTTFHNDNFSDNQDNMTQYILDCDLLIIDDLGTELVNSFTTSKLFYCINERFFRKKSTIISTNLSIESLVENYSERIFSRISSNYKLLKLYGEDIRLKKKIEARS